MRGRRAALAAILMAAGLSAGVAGAQSARLSAEQARAELLGVRLVGVQETTGAPWEECIEPSGRTVYRFAGVVMEGRLEIEADGAACFAYADTGFRRRSCFAVLREGANYRFDVFVTVRVERGVTSCPGGELFVGAPSAVHISD